MLKTFEADEKLPALPVPNLSKTLEKYLSSVRPFVSDLEFQKTQENVEEFANGIGKKLHVLLTERSQRFKNWVLNNIKCFIRLRVLSYLIKVGRILAGRWISRA